MMTPTLDQSPAHHQLLYHQQQVPEQAGKLQLTLILPNGVPSVISVDPNTPMIDLLVQASSLNKLNPSGYSLVVLDSNQHVIHFKANQSVGQIIRSCQLPQINGSSAISLLPKETPQSQSSAKHKAQPFEITVRLQINLPDGQKILLRVDPNLPLYEIKERICKQKKYKDSARYSLSLPSRPEKPLLLGLSLAECKTNELNLVYLRSDPKYSANQIQSFDRLYRVRSESQPPHQAPVEPQEAAANTSERPSSVQLQPARPPSHLITSHTSLHAYWNDPNFDTQSQTSNCSSTTKKRRAPKPPGHTSPLLIEEHHQSQESLTESTKQKRQAPIIPSAENENETEQTTPIYSQVQKTTTIESPYSVPKSTPVVIEQTTSTSPTNYSVSEIVQAGIADPPSSPVTVVPPVVKSSKKSTSTDGIMKIITDHKERTPATLESPIKTKEKSPTPIQLEVTERLTHISVTVESDRKQVITRASPAPQSTPNSPSSVASKPSGKTITEYRTIRRIGSGGETTTTTTVRTENIPPLDDDNKPEENNEK